jgi:hypothetical protein
VEPSAVPPYQASAIRPSASSASVLAWENGATFGSFSEANSVGKADTTGAGGAAKRGGATDGARQNANARATKKKTASTFSRSIDLDNWRPLPTIGCRPEAGKLNPRMLKKANKQRVATSRNYTPTLIDLDRQVNRNEPPRKVESNMTRKFGCI